MAITGKDLLEKSKKKKENKSVSGEDLINRLKTYRSIDTEGVDQTYIDAFVKDANDFFSSSEKDLDGVNWSTASSLFDNKSTASQDLITRADTIGAWLWKNKGNLNEDGYKSLSKALDEYRSGISSVVNGFESNRDFYAQFDTEDAYNAWQAKEDEKQAVLNSEDFEQYSQEGANIYNPDIKNVHKESDKIGNVVTFSRKYATELGFGEANGGGGSEYGLKFKYSFMEDDEVNLYNYYLAKYGKEKASEYLASLEDTLDQRHAGVMIQNADDTAMELLFSAMAGIEQAKTGFQNLDNLFKGTEGDNRTSAITYAQAGMSANNDGLWKVANDLANTTGNMLPSILLSTIVPVGGGLVGAASMGMSASGNAYSEMRNLGYSANQARAYAGMVGVSEAALSYALGGISKLGGKVSKGYISKAISQVDNALAKAAINLGGSMLSEGVEEGLQSVLEPIFKSIVTSEDVNIDWGEVTYSALLGALSAGLLEGAPTIASGVAQEVGTSRHGKSLIDNGSVPELQALAREMMGVDTKVDKYSIKSKTDTNAKNVGRLSVAMGESINKQNLTEVQNALTEKGLSQKEASKVAEKLINKENLSKKQMSNEAIKAVAEELVNNPSSSINERNSSLTAARVGLSYKGMKEAAKNTGMSKSVQTDVDVKDRVSADGKTTQVSTDEAITIDKSNPIAKTKDGKVYFNTDKGVVESSDVTYANESEGLIYESFVDLNPAFANALIRNYDGKMPVQSYIKGMREGVVLYGRHNFQGVGKDISNATYFAELSEADQAFALKLGRNYATHEAKVKSAPIRNALKKAVEQAKASEGTNTEGAKKTAKKGTVSFEEGAKIESTKENKAERRAEIKAKSNAVSLAKQIAKTLGIDIVFYDARTKKKGENGYKDNGYYDPETNSIHLDLQNATDDAKTIAYTLSHELVHWLKEKSPTDFNNFAKFLMEQYAGHGINTSALLKNKMAEYKADADEAYEEMICQACETLLLDSNAVVKLMELRKTDLNLFEKIKLHILQLLNKIRAEYKALGYQPSSDEAKALLSMTDVLEQIHEKFEEAMVGAAKNAEVMENLEAVQNSNKTVFGEASLDVKAVESGVKNQLKAYKKTGEASITYNDKHGKVQKAILQTGVEAMFEMAETMLPYLEEDGILPPDIPGKTIFKNGSYGKTGENTTLCVRTLTYEDFKDRVAEKVGRPLTVAESLLVSQKIYDIATEPQCIYCYVAADRKAYDEYLGEYHKAMDKYIKALRNGGDSKALYTEYLAGRKDTDAQKKRWSQWEAIAKSGKDYISASDLTTKRKRDRIIAQKNAFSEQIKDAQRYAQSASWAKTVCDYRAYKGDILKMTSKFVDMLNSEYGLRMYSFSDYTPAFIVENMQMIIDASVKGLKSLAYTKDTDYVEIFASTGQAINVSCFARWDAESGTFVEDNRQGANWEKTKNLRKQYRNVGAVMVATNDAMVEWALKQDWVDVVIPYHIVKTGTTIANEYQWNNYTSESSDKSGNRSANIYPTEHNNDFATYSNLLNERGITPRFSRWYDKVASGEITEAQYMKLVNEVRLPASELSPVVPSFNLEAAKRSFGVDNEGNVIKGGFVDKGGYMGGWYRQGVDVNQEVMAVSEDINAGKSSLEVDYGMSKSAKEKVEAKYNGKGIKFQKKGINKDGIEVYETSTQTMNLTWKDRIATFEYELNNSFANKTARFIRNGHTYYAKLDVDFFDKVIYGEKHFSKNGKKAFIKSGADGDIFDLIEGASYQRSAIDTKNHKKKDGFTDYFDYFLKTVQIDNKVFDICVNVKKQYGTKDGYTYTLFLVDNEKISASPSISTQGAFKSEGNTDIDNNISQKKPIVKRQQKKTSSYAPTFYSQMGKEIDAIKMDKVGAASLINYLKGKGIKHDEIKWSGIEAFLEGKKSVTKAELQEFLAGSQLQIEEEASGGDIDLRYDGSNRAYNLYDSNGNVVDTFTYNEFMDGYVAESDEEIYSNEYELRDALREEYGNASAPRWADYRLDGGSNYREIVFRMPNNSYSNQMMRTHWGLEAEGVLAHARIQDMTTADGKKMLFIEEIQSDYHNEGAKDGYADSESEAKINELKSIADEKFFALEDYSVEKTGNAGEWEIIEKTDKGARLLHEYREAQANYDNAMNEFVKKIPDAPFKDTYHEYVLKRLLRMAAEEGYDSIGWTPAEIQDKRWDDKQYHEDGKGKSGFLKGFTVEYDQDIPKFLRKYGKKWGATVGNTTINGDTEVWSMDITEPMEQSVLYEGQAKFQKKKVSNRTLLANALETTIDTSTQAGQNELKKLQEYKSKIDMLEKEEAHLIEVKQKIHDISFTKGSDRSQLTALNDDKIKTQNRIHVLDSQLLRYESMKPIQDVLIREKEMLREKVEAKAKEAFDAYREHITKVHKEDIGRERDKKKVAVANVRETQAKQDSKKKLYKLVLETIDWIEHPAKTDIKCPDMLKAPLHNFLKSINFDSERVLKGGLLTKNDLRIDSAMNSLANTIDKLRESQAAEEEGTNGFLDLPGDFVRVLRDTADDITNRMNALGSLNYVVNGGLNSNDIKVLTKLIRTLVRSIKTMNTLYANLRFANTQMLGVDTVGFLDSMGETKKTNSVKDFVTWDNALPYYAFRKFGEGGESIFEELMDAQDKMAFNAKTILDFKEKTWTDKEANEWSNDRHVVRIPRGISINLTTADAMSIYCLSRRNDGNGDKQGMKHLLGGGVRIIGLKKGATKFADEITNLSEADIDEIIDSLSDRQKQVAEAMQEFMSTVGSGWGNEISMKRFLTKDFVEKIYFPIESDNQNLKAELPEASQGDLYRLLNISATKSTNKHANNRLVVRNVFDVFTNHMSDMAKLNAFGMALLDYMKWVNYKESVTTDTGEIVDRSVRQSMNNTYGDKAIQYVLNLIKDINGRHTDNGDNTFLMKMIRLGKTASVGNNLRVAFLQFTSYPRAAMILSKKSLVMGLTKVPNIRKAEQYCGIALWKSFGFYDTNIARSIEDRIKGTTNIRQKIIELSMTMPGLADAITWGALWNACEYEVAKTTTNTVGSEEFYQEVGKKLREVVYATQVVDSILTRSQIMRSKSGLTQMATAYMSEPTLTANILMDAGFQFEKEKRISGSAKTAWKKTRRIIFKAAGNYCTLALLTALAESLADAWRDDDDEEFGEKFKEAFLENSVSNIVPFNKIPILADITDLILSRFDIGFVSSDNMATTWITQIGDALDVWAEVLGEELGDEETSKTVYNAIYKTAKALSSLTGISVSGAMREVVALWNNTAGAYDSTLKIKLYEPTDNELGNELYEAILEGNDRQADSIRDEFEDDESANAALRKAIRDQYKDGGISRSEAMDMLIEHVGMEADEAYWKLKEWDYYIANGTTEGYSKYTEFYDAVKTGRNLKTVIKEYTDHGVETKTLASQITSYYKPLYREMSNSERASLKGYLLNAYALLGYNRTEKSKDIDNWLKD